MIIILRPSASAEDRARILGALAGAGVSAPPAGMPHGASGDVISIDPAAATPALKRQLARMAGIERLVEIDTPYQLASRVARPENTIVWVRDVAIGGLEPVFIAGPCAVEGEAQIVEAARAARAGGAQLLRGGVFKPRTSPYSFQGFGLPGLELLARAGAKAGLPVVTEVMEPALVPAVAAVADVLQVGSRNMQNFPLLRAVGRAGRPVLLKRGFAATIEEWLLAAEYILAEGNPNVLLCERGVRSFDPSTRNLLDLSCVPLLRQLTHLPVLVDPSHATGRRDLVVPMGVAAVAAGAHGVMVEMHPHPERSISDAEQAIDPRALLELTRQAVAVRRALLAAQAATEGPEASDPQRSEAARADR